MYRFNSMHINREWFTKKYIFFQKRNAAGPVNSRTRYIMCGKYMFRIYVIEPIDTWLT